MPTGREIPVPDGALFVCGPSEGSGPAVVLLHGWTLDHRVWDPQVAGLGASARLVALDRRGFGRSTAPPGLGREPEDVLAVLDALGIGCALLVAQSQAGRVALSVAARAPDRIAGLVLQGAPLEGFLPGPDLQDRIPIDRYASLVRAGRVAAMKEAWAAHPMMRTRNPRAQALISGMLVDYAARDLAAPGDAGPSIGADRLGAVAVPALIVTGEEDTRWRRLVGDALAYGLPKARRIEFEDAGHLCNLCRPKAFNAALMEFLQELERTGAFGSKVDRIAG